MPSPALHCARIPTASYPSVSGASVSLWKTLPFIFSNLRIAFFVSPAFSKTSALPYVIFKVPSKMKPAVARQYANPSLINNPTTPRDPSPRCRPVPVVARLYPGHSRARLARAEGGLTSAPVSNLHQFGKLKMITAAPAPASVAHSNLLVPPASPSILRNTRRVTYTGAVDWTPPCQPGLIFPPHAFRLASPHAVAARDKRSLIIGIYFLAHSAAHAGLLAEGASWGLHSKTGLIASPS